MNTVSRTLFALILLSSASTAVASPESGGRAVAQIAAPDVSSWTEIAEGLYQGVGRQGETVTVFAGPRGMELLLAERQRELEEARADLRAMTVDGGSELAQQVLAQHQRIGDLKLEISHLEDFLADASESEFSTEVSQSISLSGPQVCSFIMYGDSTFVANFAMVDSPSATATFSPFGSGAQFGPIPPLPPNTFRSVSAQVQGVSGYTYSYDRATPLSMSQSTLTFGGSCNMETTHTVSAHCTLSSPPTGWAVTRRQTCDGVLNGRPPF
jgi:Root cap